MCRRRICIVLVIAVILAGPRALADNAPTPELEPVPTFATLVNRAELYVPSLDRKFEVPVGTRILTPPSWDKLQTEIKRLQDEETRRLAENKSLRAQAASWRPGWKTILVTALTGFTGGVYAYHRFQ